MIVDRSKRLYVLSDIRIYVTELRFCNTNTKPLWKKRLLWRRANGIGFQFGTLLAAEGFKVPGFRSLYLIPTTGRFHLDPRFEPEFGWWHREARVPIDLAEWSKLRPNSSRAKTVIVDWIERGVAGAAHRLGRNAEPVRRVAAHLRELGAAVRLPRCKVKNRHGWANAELLASDNMKGAKLVVTVQRTKENGVTRQASLALQRPHDAFLLCRGLGFDGSTVVLKRTNSIATQVAGKGFPKRVHVSQMATAGAGRRD